MLKYGLIFIILSLIFPSTVSAATYFVSPTGSSTNTGLTTTSPWSLSKATGTAAPGDIVQLMAGTYYQKLAPVNSGRSGNYITYMPYQNGTVILDGTNVVLSSSGYKEGLVEINGKSYLKILGLTLRNSKIYGVNIHPDSSAVRPSYIEISNLKVVNSTEAGIYVNRSNNIAIKNNLIDHVTCSSGIGIWFSDTIFVDHNAIVNAHITAAGTGLCGHEESLSLGSVTNFEVSYNDISMTSDHTGVLGNEGIDAKEASRYGKIHHNYIHDYQIEGGAIYIDAWNSVSPSLSNIDIYNNLIKNNSGGIIIGSEEGGTSENINVYNNVVYNIGSTGIGVVYHKSSAGTEGFKRNINILNNTVYKAQWNGGGGIYITAVNISNINIKNNLVYFNNTNGDISVAGEDRLSHVSADHNSIYHVNSTGTATFPSCSLEYPSCIELSRLCDTAYANYTASRCNTFSPYIHDNYRGDPQLVSLIQPDLHLQPSSPAINKGVDLRPLISVDHDGVSRPQSTAFDIGAYEYTSNPITNSPIPTKLPTVSLTLSPSPAAAVKPGDANNDTKVDGLDFSVWLTHYKPDIAQSGSYTIADFNKDSFVDGIDYSIWLTNYSN